MSTFTFQFSTSEITTANIAPELGECEVQHTYNVEAEMCFEDDIQDAYPHILTATCETRIYYGQNSEESVAFAATEIFQNTTGKFIWATLEAEVVSRYFTPTYEPHPAPSESIAQKATQQTIQAPSQLAKAA